MAHSLKVQGERHGDRRMRSHCSHSQEADRWMLALSSFLSKGAQSVGINPNVIKYDAGRGGVGQLYWPAPANVITLHAMQQIR